MANILIMSNPSYAQFGYSVVSRYVARALRDSGHNVFIFAMHTVGASVKDDFGNINLPISETIYGNDGILENYLRGLKIDMLITIFDTHVEPASFISDMISALKIKWINHCTINHEPLSPEWYKVMIAADLNVIPSRFGMEVASHSDITNLVHIPHGVDMSVFKQFEEKERIELRKSLGVNDKFVFMFVGRNNSIAKNHTALLSAYRIFLEKCPEAVEKTILWMHSDPRESPGAGFNFAKYAKLTNMEKNIIMTKMNVIDGEVVLSNEGFYHHSGFALPQKEMCKLYNIADCIVTASMGESFYLPGYESMVCGVPQIFPDHTVGKEMVGKPDTGILVPIRNTLLSAPIMSELFMVDIEELANSMEKMYKSPEQWKIYSKNAVDFASKFDWNEVTKIWIETVNAFFTATKPVYDYMNREVNV